MTAPRMLLAAIGPFPPELSEDVDVAVKDAVASVAPQIAARTTVVADVDPAKRLTGTDPVSLRIRALAAENAYDELLFGLGQALSEIDGAPALATAAVLIRECCPGAPARVGKET